MKRNSWSTCSPGCAPTIGHDHVSIGATVPKDDTDDRQNCQTAVTVQKPRPSRTDAGAILNQGSLSLTSRVFYSHYTHRRLRRIDFNVAGRSPLGARLQTPGRASPIGDRGSDDDGIGPGIERGRDLAPAGGSRLRRRRTRRVRQVRARDERRQGALLSFHQYSRRASSRGCRRRQRSRASASPAVAQSAIASAARGVDRRDERFDASIRPGADAPVASKATISAPLAATSRTSASVGVMYGANPGYSRLISPMIGSVTPCARGAQIRRRPACARRPRRSLAPRAPSPR